MATSSLLQTGLALIVLQLFSRLLTFSLNQALVRLASPEALGTAAIQLDVLLNTVLFLSRENVRGALSRVQSEFSLRGTNKLPTTRYHQIINCCFLPILSGFLLSTVLFLLYYLTLSSSTYAQPHFKLALFVYYLSTLTELVSEPAYLYHLLTARTAPRIRVEGTAVLLKTCTTLLIVFLGARTSRDWALLGFSIGQLIYASWLAIGLWHSRGLIGSLSEPCFTPKLSIEGVPRLHPQEDYLLGRKDFSLICALTQQSVLKQFLSEGDKMLVGRLCPIANQGAYALALNYGSLAARIVFQPIEESARLYFSKAIGLGQTDEQFEKSLMEKRRDEQQSSTGELKHLQAPVKEQVAATLTALVLLQSYVGIFLLSFGPSYVECALLLVLGPNSSYLADPQPAVVIQVLKTYCGLLPLLALNGVLEAFVQSVANEAELAQMSKLMFVWCALFAGSAYSLRRTGEVGVVYATCLNMACRISYGWRFVRGSLARSIRLAELLPAPAVTVSLAVAAGVVRWSGRGGFRIRMSGSDEGQWIIDWSHLRSHLGVGLGCLVACVGIGVVVERARVRRLVESLRTKQD